MKKALYLSGGGARSAYQVGVLQAIYEITKSTQLPVQILSSVSAGSINAAYLAMHADNFEFAVSNLVKLWSCLSCNKIYHSSNFSLLKSITRNFFSALTHYNFKAGSYLLDTTPLRELLVNGLDFKKINSNIEQGIITDFEIAATCYDIHGTISFFKSKSPQPVWKRIRHISNQTEISSEHILASTAIPLFFPAIKIGNYHYGDGSIRLNAPLRAATCLGAESILIISNRQIPKPLSIIHGRALNEISFATVLGSMLNALFLDNIDRDLELLNKINESLSLVPRADRIKSKWRPIKTLHIAPSTDLGKVAEASLQPIPLFLRYLMRAFGTKEQSGDLVSFLLFETEFCKKLIEIGYHDGMNNQENIKKFFEDDQ